MCKDRVGHRIEACTQLRETSDQGASPIRGKHLAGNRNGLQTYLPPSSRDGAAGERARHYPKGSVDKLTFRFWNVNDPEVLLRCIAADFCT